MINAPLSTSQVDRAHQAQASANRDAQASDEGASSFAGLLSGWRDSPPQRPEHANADPATKAHGQERADARHAASAERRDEHDGDNADAPAASAAGAPGTPPASVDTGPGAATDAADTPTQAAAASAQGANQALDPTALDASTAAASDQAAEALALDAASVLDPNPTTGDAGNASDAAGPGADAALDAIATSDPGAADEPSAASASPSPRGARGNPVGAMVAQAAQDPDRSAAPAQTLDVAGDDTTASAPRSWHMLQPGHPGSALMPTTTAAGDATSMDEAASSVLDALAVATGAQADQAGSESPGHQDAGGASPGDALIEGAPDLDPSAELAGSDAPDFNQQLREQMQRAYQSASERVSLMLARGVQEARLRLETASERTLEIDLKLRDGLAHLDFRSDHAATRDALRQHGHAALSEALQQHGIGLGGLSVGSQARQQPDAGTPPGRRQSLGRLEALTDDMPGLGPRGVTGMSGGRTLDVYA